MSFESKSFLNLLNSRFRFLAILKISGFMIKQVFNAKHVGLTKGLKNLKSYLIWKRTWWTNCLEQVHAYHFDFLRFLIDLPLLERIDQMPRFNSFHLIDAPAGASIECQGRQAFPQVDHNTRFFPSTFTVHSFLSVRSALN